MTEKAAAASARSEIRTFPGVILYTSYDCVWCVKAKQYLAEHGVPYTEKNVEDDEAIAREALSLAGRKGVPVIAIGSGVVVGFRQQELNALLGLGEANLEE
jgi:glutaredoxin 3